MAFTHGTYTFDTQTGGDELDWIFTGPGGTGLNAANTSGNWSWEEDATSSTNVGPDYGQGGNPDGYAYTEMSSQTSGAEWTLELDKDLDASANTIEFDFYWCMRGDSVRATIQVQTNEGGAGWVNRGTATGYGDVVIPATSGATEWNRKTVDLSGLVSDSTTRVRIYIVATADPTTNMWENDIGIDTVTVTGTTIVSDPVVSDVDTDEDFYVGQTGVTVSGSFFETDGANSRLRIDSSSAGTGTSQTQTDTSWADASLEFTASLGSLSYGTNYLFVRNQSLLENSTGFPINLYAELTTTSLSDSTLSDEQTLVEVNGTNFNATQGSSKVYLCDLADGSGVNVEQTVTTWTDEKITFTVNRGLLLFDTIYVIVGRNQSSLGDSAERLSNAQTATLEAPAGAFTHGPYTFDTLTSGDEDDWLFTGPAGTLLGGFGTSGRWSWDEDDTPSADVGPQHGQGGNPDGYIYTEMSSQPSGAEWFLELDMNLDASANDLQFDFYWCMRGDDVEATIQLQSNEDGAGWVDRGDATGYGDVTIPGTGGATEWNRKSVDLTGLVSDSSTRLRLYIVCVGATPINNDVGIDTINIIGVPKVASTAPSITSISDGDISIDETGVIIAGSNFLASQSTGKVEFCPANSYASAVEQTVTNWSASSITITVVQGTLSTGTVYAFITNSAGERNSSGYPVTLSAASTSAVFYKTAIISEKISDEGLEVIILLVKDQ